MRVVITGATGNIGTAVVDRLRAGGHDVQGLARRPPRHSGPATAGEPYGAPRYTALDLTGDDRDVRLRAAFAGAEAVVHLAWGFQPTRNTAYLHRLDVGGTTAVLEAARATGIRHLVHVSSLGAYSPGRAAARPVEEDWPTGGFGWLPYSRHKAAAERLLDAHEAVPGHLPVVARVRPSLTARREVGGALDRYTLPSLLPARLVGALPVLPLDRGFRFQLTHSEDIASGIVAILERGATGPFNLAADPVLTREDVARALRARPVHLPWPALRAAATLAWWLRLQPVDPGWLDMAWQVPLMSSRRAREELDWEPRHDARAVLAEAVGGMVTGAGTGFPALRPRRWSEQLSALLNEGPVSRRRRA
jgi:UDP-glucose 4-epimerase